MLNWFSGTRLKVGSTKNYILKLTDIESIVKSDVIIKFLDVKTNTYQINE